METIKLFSTILLLGAIYLFVLDNDYQNMFDKQKVISYNCDMLNEGVYASIPLSVIEECRKLRNVKTY